MKNQLNLPVRYSIVLAFAICCLASCEWKQTNVQASVVKPAADNLNAVHSTISATAESAEGSVNDPVSNPAAGPVASSAVIFSRIQVPILCYHQIRDYRPADSRSARDYIVPPADFKAQMKGLADSGYTTILPDQLYQYLATGKELPKKSVLISFDDGCDEQFDITNEILKPLNFKAAFFIMTVSVNRPNYMKAEQIRQLSDAGHSIGLHTWDHHNVKQYKGDDWIKQIEKPKVQLEKIINKPIQYFAYPFGLWNTSAIPELKSRGLIAAFQLSTARDQSDPLYTIRRIIVPGGWNGAQLVTRMKSGFKG
jgi:peptidoglycan/xylan/chitin deacetylase (PgdA/CDA1 family)